MTYLLHSYYILCTFYANMRIISLWGEKKKKRTIIIMDWALPGPRGRDVFSTPEHTDVYFFASDVHSVKKNSTECESTARRGSTALSWSKVPTFD